MNIRLSDFIKTLNKLRKTKNLSSIKKQITGVKTKIALRNLGNENGAAIRGDILVSELEQILKSQTQQRALYYINRLHKSLKQTKTNPINDLNLSRWKEYDNIITDSLWLFDKRDSTGTHLGWYWGNFVPQIPHQLISRFTKRGDWILDPFCGSGTTLIECKKLGRNGIGVELNSRVAKKARQLISKEQNPYKVSTKIVTGDSHNPQFATRNYQLPTTNFQLAILHPPYHDIIKFSKNRSDLSNAKNTDGFLSMLGKVVDNVSKVLEKGRHLALVIGDKYHKREWIPLGFYSMNEILKRGYTLKSIIVKNFEETRGKRGQKELWRYRALSGGFYIFKHEYIFIFQKKNH
ncbi:MAG: DNA methyltransferase [Planctomycetes bacterium]|nr:DNA methyltransferase [Planctomycetota bacterium]